MAYEWKTALDQHQSPLNPEEHGQETGGNRNTKIKWTTKAPSIIQYSKILKILGFFFFNYTEREKALVNILKLFSNNTVKQLQLRKNKVRIKFFKKANKTELLQLRMNV